jgi:hypothetical protein
MLFRKAPSHATQPEKAEADSGHEIAIFEGAAFRARFVVRGREKAT